MTTLPFKALCVGAGMLALTSTLPAVMLAHYDFTDGDLFDNEVGPTTPDNTLNLTGAAGSITANANGSASFPGADGAANRAYLDVFRGLGAGSFTVSLWFRTSQVDQGGFQGIFSNNNSSTAANSWQVDVHNGVLRLISANGGAAVNNGQAGEPQIQADTWHHVVAQKSGGTGYLWFGTEGNLQQVGSSGANPGGLQWLRLGVNRNSDSLYAMELANVRVYDNTSQALLTQLNVEGPQLPESGHTFPLLGLALGGLLYGCRRK